MTKSIVIKTKKKGMVALFMAITIQVILTFSFLEFTDNNMRYISTVRNYEDKVKSKYLAKSSVNFSILLLQIQTIMIEPLNKKFKQFNFNIQIWQQFPVSSEALSMIFDEDSSFFQSMIGMDDEDTNETETRNEKLESKLNQKEEINNKIKAKDGKIEQEDGKMKFENKFKFDGDFFAEITDETRKYNINFLKEKSGSRGKGRFDNTGQDRVRKNLTELFNQPESKLFFESERENETVIPVEEVVASMQDWIDTDEIRAGYNGGAEDDRYTHLKRKYKNRNHRLYSMQELYMVYGVDDDFMEAFGESLTVYTDNQININTCDEAILRSVIRGIIQDDAPPTYREEHSQEMAILVSEILEYRTLSPFSDVNAFYAIIDKVEGLKIDPNNKKKFQLTTTSTVFKIVGYGSLNEAISKITVVVDMKTFTSNGKSKQYLYYREE